jgi:hypothetical protein
MKKFIFLCIVLCTFIITSCLEDYLDKAPESGLTKEDVFSKYDNFKSYFDDVYGMSITALTNMNQNNLKQAFSFYFALWGYKFTWEELTDMSDPGWFIRAHKIKNGEDLRSIIFLFTDGTQSRPILPAMFKAIRKSNMTLQNIGMLKDASQEDIDDLIAQAHFVRAFAHFALFRIWGPMPYITKVIGPDDQWDIPRLSKHETLMRIAADMDTAATFFAQANRMRRDPLPGQPGHLNNPDQYRPTGVAAKAFKARALLYAASPQNNELGTQDWVEAAKANWEAIKIAEQYGYDLLLAADYKLNFSGTNYTNEELWAWATGPVAYTINGYGTIINGVFGANTTNYSGECPTQNFVDKFETKWGEPLNTQADRDAATSATHYKEQDPYKDRDPRFYIDIIYNEATIPGYTTAKIYYDVVNGKPVFSELLNTSYAGVSVTGYYNRKLWGGQSVNNKITPLHSDPIIRLAELYLNYAEAANEAYGPNTPAPGATMTAVQAINKIRTRVAMPDVLPKYTGSKDAFRPRIKNERTIELCFEGHYYYDIRRWMDAPGIMAGPLIGMDIERVKATAPFPPEYPRGYKHTRIELSPDRQVHWKDAMYYFPFSYTDMYKMKNFVANEVW